MSKSSRTTSAALTTALVTSLPPAELSAAQWLADNRAAWGLGRFRRFSHSLFLEWRRRQQPRPQTTTDVCPAMNAEHQRYALRCLWARRPRMCLSPAAPSLSLAL